MKQVWFNRFEEERWNSLFLLHSKTKGFKHKIEKAKEKILDAFAKYPKWYVAFSGGKDSLCVVGLCAELGVDVELFSFYDDRAFSFTEEYIRYVAEYFDLDLDFRYFEDRVLNRKYNVNLPSSKQLPDVKEWIDKNIKEKNKNAGVFMGLRIEESKSRKMHLLKNLGYATQYKTENERHYKESWYCNPVAELNSTDIFAYLLSRNIPIIDIYKRYKMWIPEDPRAIRFHNITPRNFADTMIPWLKYHYPDEYKRMIDAGHLEVKEFV